MASILFLVFLITMEGKYLPNLTFVFGTQNYGLKRNSNELNMLSKPGRRGSVFREVTEVLVPVSLF